MSNDKTNRLAERALQAAAFKTLHTFSDIHKTYNKKKLPSYWEGLSRMIASSDQYKNNTESFQNSDFSKNFVISLGDALFEGNQITKSKGRMTTKEKLSFNAFDESKVTEAIATAYHCAQTKAVGFGKQVDSLMEEAMVAEVKELPAPPSEQDKEMQRRLDRLCDHDSGKGGRGV